MERIKPVGGGWLRQHFGLAAHQLSKLSYVGLQSKFEEDLHGTDVQFFPQRSAPQENNIFAHIEFFIKNEPVNLDFLKSIFDFIAENDVANFIAKTPAGKYTRKIGFLYEFLTRREVVLLKPTTGNYVDILDTRKCFTGTKIQNSKWRVNDNLLGNQDFCPTIERSPLLDGLLKEDFRGLIEKLSQNFSADTFQRATNYLFTKETRSSYQIEKERPTPERVQRFVALLYKAGEQPDEKLLSQANLVAIQNEIVDPRFKAVGFRDFQNYIGQTLYNYEEFIHYVCPPPNLISSLMNGIANSATKIGEEASAILKATAISFGFVFTHPFEDGNGRIHRFLIHDILVRGGVAPKGTIIPISAHIINQPTDYDSTLESFSKPLMQRIKYTKNEKEELVILNQGEVEGYYRYPNLTAQCTYLAKTVKESINKDMANELRFIQNYDEAKALMKDIVDMPDKEIDLFIKLLHQNKGAFPNRRKDKFSFLTEQEITCLVKTFNTVFEQHT